MKLPLWAKYLATNQDGKVWVYEEEPERAEFYWCPQERTRCMLLHLNHPPKDWTQTLEKISEK